MTTPLHTNLKEPKNFNPDPHFSFLVNELFAKVDDVTKERLGGFASITAKKLFIIEEFIKAWKHYVGLNIFPATRLIFPNRDGRLYFMRDVGLARLVTKMCKIPKNSADYKRVNDWKKNYHDYKRQNHDKRKLRALSYILAQQVSERRDLQPKGDDVTIAEINDVLDNLGMDELGKAEKQIELLRPIIDRLSTEELRWFFQIILKDSMIAPMETFFFLAWHPDAPAYSNVVNNLKAVFWRLTDETERLHEDELKVHLMYPFLPQLAAKPKLSYEELALKMEHNFYIEEKIDGDRMLMHMQRNPDDKNDMRFKYYTRRCRDYSLLYGEDLKYGAISKYLRHAFNEGVTSVVLDGEMVAWDYRRNVILPFGTLKASAVQEAVRHFTTEDAFADQSAWPLYIIYDILYLNGIHLEATKLIDRRAALRRLVNEIPHRFEVLDTPIGHSAQDIEDAIRKTVLERSEGVMLKNINLKYKIALRDNSWVKIKPEYLEQFGENLDLVVIGVIKGVKNAYMCALKDATDGVYKSFCTVANGFSEKEYDEISRITATKWHVFKTEPPPPERVIFGSRKPDLWIYPEDSLVLEIKARSIDASPLATYAVGTTLHNLYCRQIRDDKSFEECITVQEYREMKRLHSTDNTHKQDVIKEKKKSSRRALLESFSENTVTIKAESTLFNSFSFMILSGKVDNRTGERIADTDIAKVIKKYGGTITQSINEEAAASGRFICISEIMTIKARQIHQRGIDLIKPKWIFQCVRYASIIPLEPPLIFKGSNTLIERAKRRLDSYGDSYILHPELSIDQYVGDLNPVPPLQPRELKRFRSEIITDINDGDEDSPLAYLFADIQVYIVALTSTPHWQREGLQRSIERYQGIITKELTLATFIIIMDYDRFDFKISQEIEKKVNKISKDIAGQLKLEKKDIIRVKIPNIVRQSFILESIHNKVLVDPQDHKF